MRPGIIFVEPTPTTAYCNNEPSTPVHVSTAHAQETMLHRCVHVLCVRGRIVALWRSASVRCSREMAGGLKWCSCCCECVERGERYNKALSLPPRKDFQSAVCFPCTEASSLDAQDRAKPRSLLADAICDASNRSVHHEDAPRQPASRGCAQKPDREVRGCDSGRENGAARFAALFRRRDRTIDGF
jgi:hypothetical protein